MWPSFVLEHTLMIELLQFFQSLIQQLEVLAQTHIHLIPFIIFGLLMLAGMNFPISEDLLIFITAIIAVQNPSYAPWLYLALFLGALVSDLVAYSIGRFLGPKLFYFPMFKKLMSKDKLHRMANFYNKYGLGVIVVGRFIPFGVRNLMFITAGLGKANFFKFLIADLTAVFVTVTSYFLLFYHFGEAMLDFLKRMNVFIFLIFIISISIYLLIKKRKKQKLAPPEKLNPAEFEQIKIKKK